MRHVIVDGYNVLRTASRYKTLAAHDLEAARAKLVADAAGLTDCATRVTVVFDAAMNERSTGAAHHVAGVAVVFSPHGMTADDVVEHLAARAKSRGDVAVVVTSDAETQRAVMGGTALRMSSREFEREVQDAERDARASAPAGTSSVPLERRIDDDVRRALDRWIGLER